MNIEKKDIQHIKTFLTTALNVDFLPYKDSTVMRRVEKRMTALQLTEAKDYISHLKKHEQEARILGEDIFINVTDFFRDPHVFQKIKLKILPIIFSKKKRTIKFWVAGCATGEEAYSLAILIREFCEENNYTHKIKIIATDIKEEAINKARQGVYTVKEILGVNRQRLRRFFDREGDKYRIKKHIRSEVIFAIHDITADPPFARADLVSCRNLLIYLDKENQQKVLASLVFALNIDGFLVLGKSETAVDLSYDLKSISSAYKIYKRIKNTRTIRRLNFDISYQDSLLPVLAPPNENEQGMKEHELAKSFQQIIHQKYAPAVVIIDEQFYVKHITHPAKQYIDTPEDYTKIYSLTVLAPEEVTALVRAAISEIKKGKSVNIYPPLPITYEGEVRQVSITVESLTVESGNTPFYAIIFEEQHENGKTSVDVAKCINLALQTQLADTEENLRKTIEKLENTNQNLLASNEELQSTNEEYISVNEELQTINSEYQDTINELSISNKDVDHLLQSTDIGTVFLDDELHIRKFTNPIKNLINIDDIDLRRPLKNFTHNLQDINIYKEVKAVLDSNQAIEKEVVSEDDIHYLMRATPYDVDEEQRKGIVLSFVNIQKLIEAEKALVESELLYRSVFDYANDGIILYSRAEDKIINANKRHLDILGYTDKKEYLALKPEDIYPETQSDGKKTKAKVSHYRKLNKSKDLLGVEWTMKHKDGTLVETEVNTVRMPKPYKGYFLHIVRDITQRKKVQAEILASQKRFEAVFDNCPVGVGISSIKSRSIIRVNKTFGRMTGYTPKQLSQMSFVDITHHEDRRRVWEYLKPLISGKKKVITFDKRYVKKNGNIFWARLWVSIMDDGSGEKFFVSSMRDISKEKEAEKKLQDRELRYRSLFEKNIDAVIIYDVKNNKILSANKSACKLFDCSKKYLLEHIPMDFFPEFQENGEPSLEFFGKQMRNYVQKGEIRHFMQLVTKKGKPIEVEITAFQLYDSPDSEMVVQFKNITEQKNAQKALQASEERFRSLFENSAIGIGVFDIKKMTVVDCNQQYAQLHGFTIEEFKKTKPEDATPILQADGRDTITHMREQIEAVIKNGSYTVNNWLCKRKDGIIFHAQVTLNILNQATPNIIFVHMYDITEKLTTQQALQESEEQFRSLFEHSADAVSIIDSKKNTFLDTNRKSVEMFGCSKAKLMTKLPKDLSATIQADGRPTSEHIKELTSTVKKQGHYFTDNWINKRADGTEFYTEVSVISFPAPNEHIFIIQRKDITERLQAQQEIQRQKDYLRTIIDVIPMIVTVKDTKGNYLLTNQIATEAFGMSVDEVIGRNDEEFKSREGWRSVLESDKKVVKTGEVLHINDIIAEDPNGEIRYGQATKVPIKNEAGEVTQILTVVNDITEIKKAEKLLQEQKDYLNAIINLTPSMITAKDTEGNFVLANQASTAIYGVSVEKLIGKNRKEFDFGFGAGKSLTGDKKVIQTGEMQQYNNAILSMANGEERTFQITKVPLRNDEGKIIQVLAVANDITELKQTERNLRESQARFKAVFENSYSTIAIIDAEGIIIEQNKPFEEANTVHEITGKPIWKSPWFFHDKKVAKQIEKDFKKVKKGKFIVNQSTYSRTSDKLGYMSYSFKPIYIEEDGELLFVLGESRDITDLMLAQKELGIKIDELNNKNEELKKYIDSNMQLENFAYITSHDLREPLRTISGFANLLEKKYVGKLDQTADEYLGYILTSTKNMNALIEDLLIFSRVHTGEHKVEKLDVEILVKQVIKSLDSAIKDTDAIVTYENFPNTIVANETKMKQLFQNLIANAIKFRKPDTVPEVKITAKSKGKFWEFSIVDNGIGIREEYFDKIFMIFKRLHTKEQYNGTGIGLSLCKKIVEQHGGEIHPESTFGEGTTFYFTIAK